jgi:transcriptional regulator with XRE-family HTH domain
MQRQTGGRSTNGRKTSSTRSAGRRFSPSLKGVTDGGRVYGGLVINKRARLGLSQTELAARVHTSAATIARIEEGHPPGAELSRQLSKELSPEPPNGPMRRLASSVPMRRLPAVAGEAQGYTPRLTPGSRRIWGAAAIGLAVVLLAVLGSQLLSGDDAPPSEPFVQVSGAPGAAATIHLARVEAHKQAVAEARRAAREARERERAAAAAAAAAAARKAKKAAATEQSSSSVIPPAAAPVESSPSPSSGSGGSNAPAPDVQHGIGSGGGLSAGD